MGRQGWFWWVVGLAVAAAGLGAVLLALAGRDVAVSDPLPRPPRGQALAEHLADGTPVWVVGHDDGTLSILSAFDTHRPFDVGKLTVWCPGARAFENPHHGSKWDEFGVRLDGPAPRGLPGWEAIPVAGGIVVGEPIAGAPPDARPSRPDATQRDWCAAGRGGPRIWHAFGGWTVWRSPQALADAAPDGWVLLEGRFDVEGLGIRFCSASGCEDSIRVDGLHPEPNVEFRPMTEEETHVIARVRDGTLVDVTRLAGPIARER